MRITRSIDTPIRNCESWEQRWKGADEGLITCWERGRQKSEEEPALAARAREGQLVLLPWKGGVEKAIKAKQKFGTLWYLAMWQGLRGEDLEIDTDDEPELICAATNVRVVFTRDISKYGKGEPT